MPSTASNRRLFYRQPMYLRIDLRAAGAQALVPATLVDLSAGGCRIEARSILRPRSAAEFDLPRPGRTTLRLPGTIRKVAYVPRERLFRYAVEFENLSQSDRDELIRFISEEQRRPLAGGPPPDVIGVREPMNGSATRIQALRSNFRVEVNVPVRYMVGEGAGPYSATAVDVSMGGIRIIADQVLLPEWIIRASFVLPDGGDVRSFSEIRVNCRPLAGVKHSRGRFIQSLTFLNPDSESTREIKRFVDQSRLARLRPL
jgi:c-di-GMP-binding flagellar brake protein YcgR